MKKRQVFEEIKTKDDLTKMFQNNIEYLIDGYLNQNVAANVIVKSLSMNEEQEKEVLSFLHFVDSKMNFPGQGDYNKRHKIPTIVSGINYILNHEDRIKELNQDELMVLSKLSITEDEEAYSNLLDIYTKDILSEIVSKDNRYGFREFFVTVVEKLHEEGKKEKAILKYLKDNKNEDLIQEAINYDNSILERFGLSDDSRRI